MRRLLIAALGLLLAWGQALAASPQRIVSLLPVLTEAVCALGQCSQLVGVDRDSNYPPDVQRLAPVGSGLEPQIETIVALRPDVVLAGPSTRATARLRALGLTVQTFETQTYADAQAMLVRLGQLLGQPAAAVQVWQRIEADLAQVAKEMPAHASDLRVYFEADATPYAAGAASFIGQSLGRLGVRNIVPADWGPFPKLNPEFIVRADPDIILLGARHAGGLEQRPGWAALRAIRQHRICRFTPQQMDTIVRAGPRLAEGARALADCIRAHATRLPPPRP